MRHADRSIPASIDHARARHRSLDMRHNMMREFSEDFLGNPEHDGNGDPIDYTSHEPFRSLNAARNAGKIRVHCLGVGLDSLNFIGDILTVAVFDADVFDDIINGLVETNDEGIVTGHGPSSQQFTFDSSTVDGLLTTEAMAAAACLSLALHHSESMI
jgi:hypothetical protein